MNPYQINIQNLKESKEITSVKELVKLQLVAEFLKITSQMSSSEIISLTELNKTDLSRMKTMDTSCFSTDKMLNFLDLLGYVATVRVRRRD